eukprot:6899358-Alexandrium_andersonii.AAC.1
MALPWRPRLLLARQPKGPTTARRRLRQERERERERERAERTRSHAIVLPHSTTEATRVAARSSMALPA